MSKGRILFSVPTKSHVGIALDEMSALQEKGYECSEFPFSSRDGYKSRLSRLYLVIKNAVNLVKVSYKFKPDVIYLNSRFEKVGGTRDFLTILIFKALHYRKVLLIIKSHGCDFDVLKTKSYFINKIMLPFLTRSVSGWLFLSSEEKRTAVESGFFLENRSFVTKNIVRAGQFKRDSTFKSKHQLSENTKVLLFTGRVVAEKGIYEVVNALEKAHDTFDLKLFIVGDGDDCPDIKTAVDNSSFTDKVVFTGFIPEEDVVEYYSNADILMFPTYFTEGFSMTLFNSVAAGLSIITTPTRAAADYLSEPQNCIWVEPRDSESVYTALTRILESEALSASMRSNNIQLAKQFTREAVADELSDIINTLLINNGVDKKDFTNNMAGCL